jgi:hypothetical protein
MRVVSCRVTFTHREHAARPDFDGRLGCHLQEDLAVHQMVTHGHAYQKHGEVFLHTHRARQEAVSESAEKRGCTARTSMVEHTLPRPGPRTPRLHALQGAWRERNHLASQPG